MQPEAWLARYDTDDREERGEEGSGVRRWQWRIADGSGLAGSAVADAYSPLLARALWARGRRSPEVCATWLAPHQAPLSDWAALPDLPAAVARLATAIRAGQPVAVHGDYDVDGLAATAIVMLLLRATGTPARYHLPNRLEEGYGLHDAAIRDLAGWLRARQPQGRSLLLVLDCGTTNPDEIATATALGLDVVVLDHHVLGTMAPNALALVNPRRAGSASSLGDATAAGLALDLVRGVLDTDVADRVLTDLADLKRDIVTLAALGTIADVAPLTGENRALVARGLRALRRRQRPGLAALLRVAAVEPAGVDATALAWRLAPRLNAAGRMVHPNIGMRLLLTEDPAEAAALARLLDGLNRQRQADLDRILLQARPRALATRAAIPVLAGDDWSLGLVGLVAGRLAEELSRPVIVLRTEGELARGSARGREGFNIVGALAECRHLLTRYGGHSQAAGLALARERIAPLEDALDRLASAHWPDGPPAACLALDGAIRLGDCQPTAVADLARLEPFGRQNEEPLWLLERLRVVEARAVGEEGRHLRFRVSDGQTSLGAIAFGQGARRPDLLAAGTVDLAAAVRLNVWQGQTQVELHARDFRRTED